jgi:uncharacterized membrane protein YeaQ/YmgE (transglycosylase-associated protein family)
MEHDRAMGIGEVIIVVIGGAIIGFLGKAVAPGDRDKIPLWLTLVCGIGGIFLGNWLYVDVFNFNADTPRIDWWRHAWQIGAAAVLVVVAAALTGRTKTKV